jgi:hypothetical protein
MHMRLRIPDGVKQAPDIVKAAIAEAKLDEVMSPEGVKKFEELLIEFMIRTQLQASVRFSIQTTLEKYMPNVRKAARKNS